MDIYHEPLMEKLFIYGIDYSEQKRINQQFKFDDKIVINQLEDITKTKYTLAIYNKAVERVTAVSEGKEIDIKYESFDDHFGPNEQTYFKESYYLDVDFKGYRPEAIKLYFIKNIVDPVVMEIKYVEADKKHYYDMQLAAKYDEYDKNVAMDISTGINLINVYFMPCSNEYYRAEVDLYLEDRFLGTYKNKENQNFIKIKELANKVYSVILKQYDKNNELLYKSEKKNIDVISVINNEDDDYYDEDEDE